MTSDLHAQPAAWLAAEMAGGHLGAEELLDACLERIHALDGEIGAFLSIDEDGARAAARRSDERRAAGEALGPLDGVPVALKDNLCTRGWPTTCSSRMLDGWTPPYDAHVVRRLRLSGAVIVGKTNLDEFGMGSSGEFSGLAGAHAASTRNPWDLGRVAGGSSCGSAAAVAAGMIPLALGSDTGGSARLPAALCGAVGMLPTYGRVSRYGLVAHGSSLEQVGPMARTVEDCAMLLGVIAGYDPRDARCQPVDVPDYRAPLGRGLVGVTLGLPEELWSAELDDEVREAAETAQVELSDAGARLVPVALPSSEAAVSAYLLLACCEASTNLARYDGVHFGNRVDDRRSAVMIARTRAEYFGPEVKRRLLLGTFALSAGRASGIHERARRARGRIRAEYRAALESVDALIVPTAPTLAWPLGERVEDPVAMYSADLLTVGANLAELPAISVPCGAPGELPVGLQVIGRPFDESMLFRVAGALQARLGGARLAPTRTQVS